METKFDIVIVGSGVGGSTVADYLNRNHKDLRIAIVESGPFRKKEHFNQLELDMTSLYYNRGSVLSKNMEIGLVAANTVGGSSAVYTGVSFRPPEDVLNNWRTNYSMEFLTPGYVTDSLDEIENDLSVHEPAEQEDNENNQLFKKGAEANGIPVKRLRINTKGCLSQGFCNLGCTSGGKQGALEVQIPRVVERGVTLIFNARVQTIEENALNINIQKAPSGSIPNVYPEGDLRLKAEKIVLSAGVLHTPAILLRSARKLKLRNSNIGRYLTLHPAMNVNGVFSKPITNYRGFPKTWYTSTFSDSYGFFLETSFYYPGITAKNNPGFGKMHRELMREYEKMMSILILTHDKAEFDNRITVSKKGNPEINYKISRGVRNSVIKALQESVRIFFAAGCKKAVIPGSKKPILTIKDLPLLESLVTIDNLNLIRTPLSSAHPQGGARMGLDSNQAVTDTSGKVFGTRSVYVADASLFPTSVKVNPYETVMLLAKWVAETMFNN